MWRVACTYVSYLEDGVCEEGGVPNCKNELEASSCSVFPSTKVPNVSGKLVQDKECLYKSGQGPLLPSVYLLDTIHVINVDQAFPLDVCML